MTARLGFLCAERRPEAVHAAERHRVRFVVQLTALRQMVRGLEDLVADGGLRHHALDEARAVAQDQEMDLAARTAIVEPPFDGDLFALVLPDILYVNVHSCFSNRSRAARASRSISFV